VYTLTEPLTIATRYASTRYRSAGYPPAAPRL